MPMDPNKTMDADKARKNMYDVLKVNNHLYIVFILFLNVFQRFKVQHTSSKWRFTVRLFIRATSPALAPTTHGTSIQWQ